MKILILNGSPRPNGNTSAMVDAFLEGAKDNGHEITVVQVCQKKIAGWILRHIVCRNVGFLFGRYRRTA